MTHSYHNDGILVKYFEKESAALYVKFIEENNIFELSEEELDELLFMDCRNLNETGFEFVKKRKKSTGFLKKVNKIFTFFNTLSYHKEDKNKIVVC